MNRLEVTHKLSGDITQRGKLPSACDASELDVVRELIIIPQVETPPARHPLFSSTAIHTPYLPSSLFLRCGSYYSPAEDIEGRWELVFSTQLERGYMPIRELVGFYPSREEATIDASAGPVPIGG